MLRNALTLIRSILFSIPLIIVCTITMGTVVLAGSAFGGGRAFHHCCMRLWARMILAASFVRVTASGLEKIEPSQTYVFCCNHLSYMDPPVILAWLGHSAGFLAKRSLFSIPVFGWAMRRAGNIPIDRENPRAAARNLAEAAAKVRAGKSIVIFPEGGRSPDGGLQPFLSGAFRLAFDVQVPVVPIAITGTREVLAPGSINIHGGPVRLVVADPIFTRGKVPPDRDELAASVRGVIAAALLKASGI